MINFNKSNFIFLSVVLAIFSSCSETRNLRYEISLNPRVNLPSELKTVGILNRSLPDEDTKKADILDQLLSQEGFKLDERASEAATDEFSNYFIRNQYQAKVIDSAIFKTTIISQRPEPLKWEQVERICKENEVDFLMILEFFDTKSSFTQSATPTTVTVPGTGGTTVNTNKYTVTVTTIIDQFWRIYDPKSKKIIDEYSDRRNVTSTSSGISLLAAYQAIKTRDNDVLNASRQEVQTYANQLFPRKTQIYTPYYAKGSSTLEKGARMAETRNIEGAEKVWQSENSKSDKIQGRALYNQAVAKDFFQQPDSAITLARKSYEEYGIKKGKHLANSIQRRTPITTYNVY